MFRRIAGHFGLGHQTMSHPGCPVLAVISWQSCPRCPIPTVLVGLPGWSYLAGPIQAVLIQAGPIFTGPFWLSCHNCPFLALISWLSVQGLPFLAVLSWFCPFLAVLPLVYFSGCPVCAVVVPPEHRTLIAELSKL